MLTSIVCQGFRLSVFGESGMRIVKVPGEYTGWEKAEVQGGCLGPVGSPPGWVGVGSELILKTLSDQAGA